MIILSWSNIMTTKVCQKIRPKIKKSIEYGQKKFFFFHFFAWYALTRHTYIDIWWDAIWILKKFSHPSHGPYLTKRYQLQGSRLLYCIPTFCTYCGTHVLGMTFRSGYICTFAILHWTVIMRSLIYLFAFYVH